MLRNHDVPVERPVIHCLVAVVSPGGRLAGTGVIDLLQLRDYEQHGFTFVCVDPVDEARFAAWRAAHPEAT